MDLCNRKFCCSMHKRYGNKQYIDYLFFTFFGVEVISLAGIKRMKTKNIKYDDLTTMQDNYDSVMDDIENLETTEKPVAKGDE